MSVRQLLALLFAVASAAATAQQNPKVELIKQPCVAANAIRVAVFSNGRVEVDGKATPLGQVKQSLKGRASSASEVCLHRQNPEAPEPHPNMMQVLEALVELRVPIAFYWDADFQQRVAFKQ